ncbi:response regulator transcription factor [Faecalicatena sp. AGMB00832]|uniref:Response regulator transcription factor n=1 Tax=Faecalicatena faecalis TaxID=2726362 RepID=A0ABS6CZT3_9FIRM|nr:MULTISPECIES: response regulator transcription factor [Faecalicatena]MBU3874847.1 response regulator transcription factor [Faecalicatena faecalis]MCI6465785.1 response regulator transcription factor [Faecalicatena sp.]MDY5618799.1 response regulator transcription factor [Lachnospiraceae bacterium]
MDKYKILIAEDDTDINHLLCRILEKNHYDTVQAFSGTEAKLLIQMETPDFLILDLMLPGMSGEELITVIRGEMGLDIPILVLSAKAALDTKVEVLKSGADDYLTKPFEPEEVLARVYAGLRRYFAGEGRKNTGASEEDHSVGEYIYKRLRLIPKSRKVIVNGTELSLTLHEYDILYLLVQDPEKVYSRECLYEQVWKGGYYGEDNTVNVHVSNLRKKLAEADAGEEYIKTVWGIGFKMA